MATGRSITLYCDCRLDGFFHIARQRGNHQITCREINPLDRWPEFNLDGSRSLFGRLHEYVGNEEAQNTLFSSMDVSSEMVTRLSGSSDLYELSGRARHVSINFANSHDDLTLNDFVTYNDKHNKDNLENNKNGENHKSSWNCGVDGFTSDIVLGLCKQGKSVI